LLVLAPLAPPARRMPALLALAPPARLALALLTRLRLARRWR
jgi:hypothetical protein